MEHTQREHELAMAFAQADVAGSDLHEPEKLEMFEVAYQKALEAFQGQYSNLD